MIIAIHVIFGSIVRRNIEPTFNSISTAYKLKIKAFIQLEMGGLMGGANPIVLYLSSRGSVPLKKP